MPVSIAETDPTICCTLSGSSCMYSFAVVSARECRRCDWISFTEPRFCALVAMVRQITWKFSFEIPKESARGFRTLLR